MAALVWEGRKSQRGVRSKTKQEFAGHFRFQILLKGHTDANMGTEREALFGLFCACKGEMAPSTESHTYGKRIGGDPNRMASKCRGLFPRRFFIGENP